MPSCSPRAADAHHGEISKLKSLSRALKLSLKVKQKSGGPFFGAPNSELSVDHGSITDRCPASLGAESVTAGNEEVSIVLLEVLPVEEELQQRRSLSCLVFLSLFQSSISLSGHLCCLPVCLLAECLLNYLPA